jgi:hypothetical protein
MWIVEEVIDDKDLEEVYFGEIASKFKSREARMSRGEVMGGRKRRKGFSGEIIDLSISDSDEGDGYTDRVVNGRRQSKSSRSNPQIWVGSPSTSITSSTFTTGPHPSRHTPTKRPFLISAVEVKRAPELRAVFVSSIHGSSALADVSVGEEGRQVDSICHGEALLVI